MSSNKLVPNKSDAWSRFERAVDAAVKGGPKHKTAPENEKKPKPKPSSDASSSGRKRKPAS